MGTEPPVIAIDGPAASGKGTIAAGVAQGLHFHLLDSGALYRLIALKALQTETPTDDAVRLAALAASLDARFDAEEDALVFRRLPRKESWLEVLKACPVSPDDVPRRRRAPARRRKL